MWLMGPTLYEDRSNDAVHRSNAAGLNQREDKSHMIQLVDPTLKV